MNCYLNVPQFKKMVAELASHFAKPSAPFPESAFPEIKLPPAHSPSEAGREPNERAKPTAIISTTVGPETGLSDRCHSVM